MGFTVRFDVMIKTCDPSLAAIGVAMPSVRFVMMMLPLPAAIFSLKVATRLTPTPTSVALSAGDVGSTSVGPSVSTVVVVKSQSQSTVFVKPAKKLPARSLMALVSINTA